MTEITEIGLRVAFPLFLGQLKLLSARNPTEVSVANHEAHAGAGGHAGGYTPLAPAERRGGQHRGCCRCHTKCRGCLLGLS